MIIARGHMVQKASCGKGQRLTTSGYFGVVFRIQGDLDWYVSTLKLRVAPQANLPCAWCDADRTVARAFLDLSSTAPWLGTVFTPPQPAPNDHPLWTVPGVSIFSVALDTMHCLHLGVYQHLLGSILYTLIYGGTLPGTIQQRLDSVWARIRTLYTTLSIATRLTNLTLNVFTDVSAPHANWPCLHGHAAETAALMRPLAPICSDLNSGSLRDQQRLRAVMCFVRFAYILQLAGMFLTLDEEHAATTAIGQGLKAVAWLSAEASARRPHPPQQA